MSPAPNSTNHSPFSEAQLRANRENAQHSTGPKTEEGKNRCRINALRHGLTGQFHAMSREDKIAFDVHCTSLMADFQPATYREKTLAVSIAEGTWRLHRSRALENNIFAIGMSGPIGDATAGDNPEVHAAACQARVWLTDAPKLALLTLYESRIRRNIEKDRAELAEIQQIRENAYNQSLEQAKLLARLALMNSQPYDAALDFPSPNGSVFSAPQIYRLIDFEQRLAEATFFSKNGWNRQEHYGNPGVHVPKAA